MSVPQEQTSLPRFVIQKHQSRSPHYDFRLEKDGVFRSWAIPKGFPEGFGVRRLALAVDDHSLEFGDFEGVIPAGQYGAGIIEVWDRGTYVLHEWTPSRVVFTLSGTRLEGTFCLQRFVKAGNRQWILFKHGFHT